MLDDPEPEPQPATSGIATSIATASAGMRLVMGDLLLPMPSRPRTPRWPPAFPIATHPPATLDPRMRRFQLDATYAPTADQPKAIASLAEGIEAGERAMTLLGATGTGKTMTMAATIEAVQRPALIIAHNKTLAAQLCNEFRTYFPSNAVEYFVSYYDYYQPEAYVPSRDLYIEKDSAINQEIERLRHAATAALFARRDVIVVASVSSIYGLGSPETYDRNVLILKRGDIVDRDELLRKLVSIQYTRNDILQRGTFRVRGETLEVFPAYAESAYRATLFGDEVEELQHFDPLTGEVLEEELEHVGDLARDRTTTSRRGGSRTRVAEIGRELNERCAELERRGQAARVPSPAPAHAVRHGDAARDGLLLGDRELLADPRRPQAGRAALLPDRLLPRGLRLLHRRVAPDGAADRRHVRGRPLAQADARSTTASACRARSATARRDSTSSSRSRRSSCSSRATPGEYERTHSPRIVEQIVRPTGIVDPEIDVRETKNQIDDLMNEIRERVERDERTLVTTLTKKMSRGPHRLPAGDGLQGPLPALRGRHARADPDHPRAAARRVRRARRREPAARGARPAGGLAGGDPRRRQGGLPARGDVADPDDRPRGAQRRAARC